MNPALSPPRRRFLKDAAAALLAGWSGSWLRGAEPAPVPTIQERLTRDVDAAPLALRFRGNTAEECRKWQPEFAATLRALLGPYTPPPRWKTVLQRAADLDDHRREELLLLADGQPPLPVYLLLPVKTDKKCAGVLALHGHGPYGHHPIAGRDDLPGVAAAIKEANYDYGRQLARLCRGGAMSHSVRRPARQAGGAGPVRRHVHPPANGRQAVDRREPAR